MKRLSILAALVPMLFTSCLTHIVTVSPDVSYPETYGTYSTTVTVPRTHSVTTTRVTALNDDISLCLDLQAVAGAFAQSSSVREFERLLNNASYILTNLDLNRDGYVDYLRVLETVEGRAHVFLIQAVLAPDIYQDVATLVAEMTSPVNAYVQVIGAGYLYGPNYIIQPVFISTPAIYAHLLRNAYVPWRSPWYWGNFPTYYKRPKPVYISHYQAYVNTYMTNNRYCREVRYEDRCHYPDYDRVSRSYQRNDYGSRHPEEDFVIRNSSSARSDSGSGVTQRTASQGVSGRVENARDVRTRQQAATTTTVTTGTSRNASERQQTVREDRTTVSSRVNSSGSSATKISTTKSGETTTTKRETSSITKRETSTDRRDTSSSRTSSTATSGRSGSDRGSAGGTGAGRR